METLFKIVGAIVLVIAAVLAFSCIATIPVWLLWNWLCPVLFELPYVTFTQAWGLSFLCGILFKGSGGTKNA